MVNYLTWKAKKFLNLINRIGFWNFFVFIYKKIIDKIGPFIRKPFRSLNNDRNRSWFLQEWNKNQLLIGNSNDFRVLLLVSSFFDSTGHEFQQGGAERYTLELNQLVKQLGGTLEVYQCGTHNWSRLFQDIPVYGLATDGYSMENLNRIFHTCVPMGRITIYYQMELSTPLCYTPSICVSHGVDWDAHWRQRNQLDYRKSISTILSSIRNVNKMVSVDTNTINWLRATDSNLAKKCIYIPNFVDVDLFNSEVTQEESHDGFVILYPRRLNEARGFWLLAHILPELLTAYPHLSIHFCGKAESIEKVEITHLCTAFPDRVRWYDVPPNEMPDIYRSVDLVVIPTCYSEGTSLACLEALASKKPVIATNVGGLPDLIISGYNGLLIEPEETALLDAIKILVDNPHLRDTLSENGVKAAQMFRISIWRSRWISVIQQMLDLPNPGR